MKTNMKIVVFALLAFGMFACGGNGKKLTLDDVLAAQTTLFNADHTMNRNEAPKVAKTYCQYVKQNPNDTTVVKWLYHAMEIQVLLKNSDKSIEIGNQLLKQYPQSEWAPMSLFLMGSYVYDDQLKDTAQAHVVFQRIIDEYPECELVDDAQKSIEYLGLTPEEIMTKIMLSHIDEDEGPIVP